MHSYNDLDATIFSFRYVLIITKYVTYSVSKWTVYMTANLNMYILSLQRLDSRHLQQLHMLPHY